MALHYDFCATYYYDYAKHSASDTMAPATSPVSSTMAPSDGTLRVAALAHPRMLATSVTLPLEILRAAAQASRRRPKPDVELQLLAQQSGPLALADGLRVLTDRFDQLERPDVLIVPAIWRNPRWVLKHHSWQIDVLRRCMEEGSWVCAVGSGSFLLAETGALNGQVATTHWHWFDEFAHRYPEVRLRRDQLITQSGRLFCVGSVNSIADLMVYLSGLLFSRDTALSIENQFSPEIRRRFSPHALSEHGAAHDDEKVMDVQLMLRAAIAEPLRLPALATAVGLSSRSLGRRFKAAVGLSPSQYLHQLRIEEARALLHHSNLSIAEVGWTVGLKDASAFSQQFKRAVGVSPRRYRVAVRGKTFTVEP